MPNFGFQNPLCPLVLGLTFQRLFLVKILFGLIWVIKHLNFPVFYLEFLDFLDYFPNRRSTSFDAKYFSLSGRGWYQLLPLALTVKSPTDGGQYDDDDNHNFHGQLSNLLRDLLSGLILDLLFHFCGLKDQWRTGTKSRVFSDVEDG